MQRAVPKRVSVATACDACRKSKIKVPSEKNLDSKTHRVPNYLQCSGVRPRCRSCIRRSVECHYRAGSAETRGQTLKRMYDELLAEGVERSAYRELFDLIKTGTPEEGIEILERIRAGTTVGTLLSQKQQGTAPPDQRPNTGNLFEEFYHVVQALPERDAYHILQLMRSGHDVATMLRYVQDADLLLQLSLRPECRTRYEFPFSNKWPDFLLKNDNPYLKVRIYERHEQLNTDPVPDADSDSVFEMPYHGATLVEPRLSGTKISKWTVVILDETLLHRLMELYILHAYPFFHIFQKDLFLEDLKAGQTRFCSSLLVNAVLAAASHYHPQLKGRNEPWDAQSLCYRFFAEAKRLWELEIGQSKLTTLQAALVMNTVYNMDGLDQIGNIYMVEAAKIAHSLNLFGPQESYARTDMFTARQFTAWGLFSWQAYVQSSQTGNDLVCPC